MRYILITGQSSYIGRAVQNWLLKYQEQYQVHFLNVKDDKWRWFDFSKFDVVLHVAGITPFYNGYSSKQLYMKVNIDLTLELAQKSQLAGVRHFIFMSSMSVYSGNHLLNDTISKDINPNPKGNYSISKMQAEIELVKLESEYFRVAILRPPMIYGKGSKGNYQKLSKLARILPFFPDFYNQRSMLYIGNLCEFIRQIIDRESSGVFFPQNREYVCTSELVKEIAEIHGKRILFFSLFNPFVKMLFRVNAIKKLFGNLTYEKSLSTYDFEYQIYDFKESIKLSEGKSND